MAVNLPYPRGIKPVAGVAIGVASSGVKGDAADVALFSFAPEVHIAGVYTQSAFKAATVILAKEKQRQSNTWVINSGNANAATGEPGLADAEAICASAALALNAIGQTASLATVQPFSTGVIGQRLNVPAYQAAVEQAASGLAADNWLAAAEAIMTTDTQPKAVTENVTVNGHTFTITGIAKGAGMIKPNMATMLAFMACDAGIAPALLEATLSEISETSFNRISIDGDTSTNDCFMLAATAQVGSMQFETASQEGFAELKYCLQTVAERLAQAIVRDGEGATKFVTVRVTGGLSSAECLRVAYTVAESPLVKTALFASDANWGRFCMAIGRAGVEDLDPSTVSLRLNEVVVAESGLVSDTYTEAAGSAALAGDEVVVEIGLGRGAITEIVWTTDLSYDYIKINAEYRT